MGRTQLLPLPVRSPVTARTNQQAPSTPTAAVYIRPVYPYGWGTTEPATGTT